MVENEKRTLWIWNGENDARILENTTSTCHFQEVEYLFILRTLSLSAGKNPGEFIPSLQRVFSKTDSCGPQLNLE